MVRAHPAGPRRVVRARGLPRARGRRALRLPGRGLLDRHRDARALPRGHLRPARRARGERRCRRATRPTRSCTRLHHERRADRPAGACSAATARWATASAVERAVLHDSVRRGRATARSSRACWPRARGSADGARDRARRDRRRRARAWRPAPWSTRGARRRARGAGGVSRMTRPDARGDRARSTRRACSTTCSRQPHQLGDALWRVESAGIAAARPARAASWSAGMGGSAIGGDLAPPPSATRATAPDAHRARLRARALDRRRHARALRELLGRHRGDARLLRGGRRERARRAWRSPPAASSRELARDGGRAGDRRAVGHAAARRGGLHDGGRARVRRRLRRRAVAARARSRRRRAARELAEEWGPDAPADSLAKALARELARHVPVVYGAGPTAPVAQRWKTQLNENAKLPAFAACCRRPTTTRSAAGTGAGARAPLAPSSSTTPSSTRACAAASSSPPSSSSAQPRVERVADARRDARSSACCRSCCLGDLVSVYLAVLAASTPRRWRRSTASRSC